LHHLTIEDWSRRESVVHRRDARAKLVAMLAILFVFSISKGDPLRLAAFSLSVLLTVALTAKLPVIPLLRRAAIILPFSAVFAIGPLLVSNWNFAAILIVRSYLSALAALIFIATTPVPEFIHALEQLRAPRFLLEVIQFLYRYLFVLFEEVQHIRNAAWSRGGFRRSQGFRAAAGTVGVLFARSYARASHIHHAMLSRGYQGRLPVIKRAKLGAADAGFVGAALLIALLLGLGNLP
jgi:cobalt/nickel transport system permease protein